MGDKKRKSKPDAADGIAGEATAPPSVFLSKNAPLDPLLAGLFACSAGPVKAPQINGNTVRSTQSKREAADAEGDTSGDDAEDDEVELENYDEDEEMEDASDVEESSEETAAASIARTGAENARKRKRAPPEDALEDAYMKKIAKEEAKEEKQRRAEKATKRQKVDAEAEEDAAESDNKDASEKDSDEESDEDDFVPPAHESLTSATADDVKEKSNRTVFLGNVSNEAIKSKSAKKTLITHLSSFLTTLKESPASQDGKTTPHKVESIRFRSTAFSTTKGPKRAAFAKRELMDATTHSTNAYVVYSSAVAARKAPAALNGTVVLGRHLRVDSVAHPAATDNKRCVFVGNLGFVDEEQDDEEEGRKKKKPAVPADVEEGLWRTFNAHTGNGASGSKSNQTVESVRVIRDSTTRIGKGFAYVQFKDENCVEQALLLDGKKFPPLLPRKLRVTRAKKMTKKNFSDSKGPANAANRTPLGGRASKLLGKAGAAGFRSGRGRDGPPAAPTTSSEPFIFEGHRATADNKLKFKSKSRGSKGKPKTRSSRRAAAYKAKGAWKANKK